MTLEPRGPEEFSWLRRLGAFPDRGIRFARWCELFRKEPPEVSARRIDLCARLARRDPVALSAYLPLVDLPAVSSECGGAGMSEILAAARREELTAAELILAYPGKRAMPDELGEPPDPIADSLTLGHRKNLARRGRGRLLERLLRDPTPAVAAELLKNRALREQELVALAGKRPQAEELFWVLIRSQRWHASPALWRSIVQNPCAPPRLSVSLLICVEESTLKAVAENEGLHPAVRNGALEVSGWGV